MLNVHNNFIINLTGAELEKDQCAVLCWQPKLPIINNASRSFLDIRCIVGIAGYWSMYLHLIHICFIYKPILESSLRWPIGDHCRSIQKQTQSAASDDSKVHLRIHSRVNKSIYWATEKATYHCICSSFFNQWLWWDKSKQFFINPENKFSDFQREDTS